MERGPIDLRTAAGPSRLLHEELAMIFGASFGPVVEYESRQSLGMGLYEALRDDPTGVVNLLRKIFVSDLAIGLIIGRLTERLASLNPTQDRIELMQLIARVS